MTEQSQAEQSNSDPKETVPPQLEDRVAALEARVDEIAFSLGGLRPNVQHLVPLVPAE